MDIRKSGKMTTDEIKQALIKHYNATPNNDKIDRKLIIYKPNETKRADCCFFILSGTPPKGYGIFISENRVLRLYDSKGNPFKEYYLDKGIELD